MFCCLGFSGHDLSRVNQILDHGCFEFDQDWVCWFFISVVIDDSLLKDEYWVHIFDVLLYLQTIQQ